MRNFTVADVLGTLEAYLALLPFMFAPGYVAGWALDLFEFRQRRPMLRLILAVPLSIAICPMLSYLLGRFLEAGLWVFYGCMFAACAVLLAGEVWRAKLRPISRSTFSKYIWVALGLVTMWVAVAIASIVDLQIGDRLYPSIVAFDHSVRTVITVAVAHHIPPENPFFANAGVSLRYHYLWLLFCSLPMKLVSLSPRHVVDAGVVWCGLGLMCTIALGIKFLARVKTEIERKTLIAIGLLCVTGLDILPTIYFGVVRGSWQSDMEWWNESQITSWIGSVLWVPHHVAALIACFVAFLLLRHQMDAYGRWATAPVIVAGIAFASAAGMSVYVAFTFAVAVAFWLVVLVARKQWVEIAMFASAGGVALLFAFSYLWSLRGPAGGGAFVEFAVRPFTPGTDLLQRKRIDLEALVLMVFNATLLPVNYALELGFFLLAGVLRLRQFARRKVEANANELAAWVLVVTSFLIGSFLRSGTITNNDLGWRCFLPAQLILLLWGATIVDDCWFRNLGVGPRATPRGWVRGALATLLILGVAGTAYQVFMLRMFPLLVDRGEIAGASWVVPERQFGKRAYALRSAYEGLNAQLASSAVVQSNPRTQDPILHMLYSGHETAAGGVGCGAGFGGDASVCGMRVRRLGGLFTLPEGGDFEATCREYGIDAIVVDDADVVWREPSSWIWRKRPVVANDYVRAFRCGAAGSGGRR